MAEEKKYQKQRQEMVKKQLERRNITDEQILEAFREVPRHRFVLDEYQEMAYDDSPLPIEAEQTISQPFIVAFMVEALKPEAGDRVLEIGTGSGYAAAVLSRIVDKVYTVERIESLGETAREKFAELGYNNIEVHIGDGTKGYKKAAPYEGILVSAGAPEVPELLLEQLAEGGYLIIPVGDRRLQQLKRMHRQEDGEIVTEELDLVRFVPLIGEKGWSF